MAHFMYATAWTFIKRYSQFRYVMSLNENVSNVIADGKVCLPCLSE